MHTRINAPRFVSSSWTILAFLNGLAACGGVGEGASDEWVAPTSSSASDASAAPTSPNAHDTNLPAQTLDAGTQGTPSIGDPAPPKEAGIKDAGFDATVALDADTPSQLVDASATPVADAGGLLADGSVVSSDGGHVSGGDAGIGADGSLPAGAKVVHVDSKDEWTASGFQVTAGKCYVVHASIDDQWLDLDVKSDLNGWIDTSNPLYGVFVDLRRVSDPSIGFYQFATCIDRSLDACFAIGNGATVCPHQSGELFFFVNDVPGFEDNNVGTATVTIQAQ